MSEQNQQAFRSREQELEHVGRQLGEVKEALREIAARVGLMERHLKRAFGVSKLPGQSSSTRPRNSDAADQPTIAREQVRQLFDELTREWKEESPEQVEEKLRSMGNPNLKLVAHELGVSFSGTASRKSLVAGIIGRINESIMLSRNRNVTSPRSEREDSDQPIVAPTPTEDESALDALRRNKRDE